MSTFAASRRLPKEVLQPQTQFSLEAQHVREKYSNSSWQIGEHSDDYVALDYLNDAARAFWLPRFLHYVTNEAPPSTYHLEVLLFRLSDPKFSKPVISIYDAVEIAFVRRYLEWLERDSGFLTGSTLRGKDFAVATAMWG
ncbi:hypothetical protein [Hyphomicrobium sp. 2TAF46]|uniref:hypothetical protein n=1 Tax=Hyphomicrobium sp. 2TAF46 TaxID=3233019 RepID=UPI003F9350D0